ncbi:sugar kinase [Rhodococcus marinonascens]|uniref:sugar kinase n=1 Tax=Rhodococcus marinonascens TaxID=38311 RepID=UPI000933102F|nr:sugar kinase [Rhodococcus marinonascens]
MGLLTAQDVGLLELSRQFRYGIGGAESNVAIGVARLGGSVTWFGRIGHDATGDMIERRLLAEQIATIAIRDRHPTGLMIKHHRFAHIAHLDYHRHHSAATALHPKDIPHDAIRRSRILHVTGITPALSPSAAETVTAAVEIAHSAGLFVSIDVNYRRKLWDPDTAAPVLRRLVEQGDIVFAGPEEARLVLGDDAAAGDTDDVLGQALATLGPAEVIIKSGSRGCTALIDGETHQMPAIPVDALDTVGAGDAFVAGYLAEHLRGTPPEQRVRTAIHVGALAVTVPGDCEGLPTRADLELPLNSEDVQR